MCVLHAMTLNFSLSSLSLYAYTHTWMAKASMWWWPWKIRRSDSCFQVSHCKMFTHFASPKVTKLQILAAFGPGILKYCVPIYIQDSNKFNLLFILLGLKKNGGIAWSKIQKFQFNKLNNKMKLNLIIYHNFNLMKFLSLCT